MVGRSTSCGTLLLWISFFLLSALHSSAQVNLAPNPGFEEFEQDAPCSLTTPINDLFNQVMKDWYAPTEGTPDVKNLYVSQDCYAHCFSTHEFAHGPQAPRSGNAYALIIAWGQGCDTEPHYREYLQVELKAPLDSGKTYYAEMYISRADTCKGAVNNLGMYFSQEDLQANDCTYLGLTPQILETEVITEDKDWVKISGEFKAESQLTHLTIGNFFSNSETTFVPLLPEKSHVVYYIDDVKVEEVLCPRVYEELKVSLCEGDSLEAGGKMYREEGIYRDTLWGASKNGCDSVLLIELDVTIPITDSLRLSVCLENQLTINGEIFDTTHPSGWTYYRTAAGCDSLIRWVEVHFEGLQPKLQILNPSCPGERDGLIRLEAISGGLPPYSVQGLEASYLTQLAQPIPFSSLPAGAYPLRISDSLNCVFSAEIILEDPPPLELSLPHSAEIEMGEELRIRPRINFIPAIIRWEGAGGEIDCPDCVNTSLCPYRNGYFRLDLTDNNGCRISDSILIHVLPADFGYVPNAFTPNGDGYNDRFTFFPGPAVRYIHRFALFSRWGELLFEEQNRLPSAGASSFGWDGRFENRLMPPGNYVYLIEIEYLDGKREILRGGVTLMR